MDVIAAIVPVIVLMVIGHLCKKWQLVTPNGMGEMKAIIANIMLPVTLFNALGNARYDGGTIRIVIVMFVIETVCLLVGYPLRRFIKSENGKFLPVLITTAEGGMLGYPLYIILCGESNLPNLATIDIAVTIFGFSIWCSMIGQIDSGEKMSARKIGQLAYRNPCLWGVGLGIFMGLSSGMQLLLNSPFGIVYQSTESLIVAPLSALILISLGYDLVIEVEQIKEVLSSVIVRFAVQMVMLLIAWQLLARGAAHEMKMAILVFFFLPVAFCCPVYVKKEKSKTFIATFTSIYSMITLIAFAILAFIR